MNRFDAIQIIESDDHEAYTYDDYIEAFQYLIDSHTICHLQGSYGRTAAALISSGECTPAPRVSA